MNYGEYWLLETAFDGGVPLTRVCGMPDNMREFWNKPFHGMTREETADTLLRLFADGDIVANESMLPQTEHDVFRRRERSPPPSREEILAEFGASRKRSTPCWELAYWLTPKGGRRWEEHTHADWDRFFEYDFDEARGDEAQVLAGEPIGTLSLRTADRARLDYLVETMWRWWWPHHERHGDRIDTTEISPWPATYWKSLPHAFQASFPVHFVDPNVRYAPQRVLDFAARLSKAEIAAWSDRQEREIRRWHEGYCGVRGRGSP